MKYEMHRRRKKQENSSRPLIDKRLEVYVVSVLRLFQNDANFTWLFHQLEGRKSRSNFAFLPFPLVRKMFDLKKANEEKNSTPTVRML